MTRHEHTFLLATALLLLVGCGNMDASSMNQVQAPNACAEAGGACVALVPGACASGRFGPADACGDGVGTGCCIPNAQPGESPDAGDFAPLDGGTPTVDGGAPTPSAPDGGF